METAVTKKNEKTRNVILISLSVLILILFLILLQLSYTILKSDKVYKGVYADNLDLGGLSSQELKETLNNKYKYEENNIKITLTTETTETTNKYKEKHSLTDLGISFDIETTANNVFSIGRKGNIFERLHEIFSTNFNDINISPEITIDQDKLNNIVNSFHEKTFVPVKNPEIIFNNNSVIINSGHHGISIDKEQLFNEIIRYSKERKNTKISIPLIITPQEKFDLEELYGNICTEPINATVRVVNNVMTTVSHKVGRMIDKSVLEEAVIELNKGDNITKELPITLIEPKITEYQLKANMFRDNLGTGKTYYSTDSQYNIDRNENLKLALECIDGVILAPGDTFSFDKTLGERTAEKGYKSAKVFSGGKIIDAIGGGICQVSSTLYNAVLRSNLDVLERHNHSFIVTYMPAGYDAAVAYQAIDFKFKNSTNWPIKIQGRTTDANELVITIIGTNENPGKTVEFYTQLVKTTEFKTIYIDDPQMAEGKTVIKQNGINGYVVDTYKIVKQDGKEMNRYKITTSVYIPLNKEVIRGTNKSLPQHTDVRDPDSQEPSLEDDADLQDPNPEDDTDLQEPGLENETQDQKGTNVDSDTVDPQDTVDSSDTADSQDAVEPPDAVDSSDNTDNLDSNDKPNSNSIETISSQVEEEDNS